MRYAWILGILAVLAGCHHYDGRTAPLPAPEPAAQVPPGKMWVQDSETGDFVLVDDPNAPAPAEEASPAPARRSRVPLPPSPRTVARRIRDGLPRPGVPVPPVPGAPRPRRLQFGVGVEAWGMEAAGTIEGHPDWPSAEADLGADLDLDTAVAVSLDVSLAFHQGPRFRAGFMGLQGEGETAPAIAFPPGEPIVPSELRMFITDMAFTPLARAGSWGEISGEVGFRYARASIDIFGSQRFAEGVMVTLGGDLDVALQRQTLYADVSASVGLGPDSAYLQFDTGLTLKASRVFRMRLGYRFLGMVLYDNIGVEDKERRLSIALGGPALEMGLTF